MMGLRKSTALGCAACVAIGAGVAGAKPPGTKHGKQGGFTTQVKPYAVGLSGWSTKPIFSSGDKVPETGEPGSQYRMVGIPDGLGVDRRTAGCAEGRQGVAWMTHEFPQDGTRSRASAAPAPGRSPVSSCSTAGEVLSARRAFERVYQEAPSSGLPPPTSNTTPAFSRWCSAFLADRRVGMDRSIFFANEETGPSARVGRHAASDALFDPKGSQRWRSSTGRRMPCPSSGTSRGRTRS